MRIRIISAIAAIMLLASTIAAANSTGDDSSAGIKRKWMSKVGKKITVTGTLRSAKLGWLVAFKGGGIYIYATKDSDNSKMDILKAFDERKVKVTGTLRYNPGSRSDQAIAAEVPEHFYFDVTDANVSSEDAPHAKNPKSKQVKQAPKPKAD